MNEIINIKVIQKSIDMAKEIAMLENNELGKKVRKYFIRTEERFKQVMRAALENPKFINQLSKDFKQQQFYEKTTCIIINFGFCFRVGSG